MTTGAMGTMSANALRGYTRALRIGRDKTQADVAAHLGMPLSTYKDWEYGKTKDIKTPYLLRAVLYLRGSLEHLASLSMDATAEDGERLAELWVNSPLATAVEEARAAGDHEALERFSRYLQLVARGVPAEAAAREVLGE